MCTFTNDTFDMAIDAGAGAAAANTGTSFSNTLTVHNVGSGPAAGDATVVGELPAGLVWGAFQPAGCTVAGQVLTCVIPAAELGAGAAGTRAVAVKVPAGTIAGVYTIRARVDHAGDRYAANDSDSASVTVVVPPPLSLPDTGTDSRRAVMAAAGLLLVGCAAVVLSRRRSYRSI